MIELVYLHHWVAFPPLLSYELVSLLLFDLFEVALGSTVELLGVLDLFLEFLRCSVLVELVLLEHVELEVA